MAKVLLELGGTTPRILIRRGSYDPKDSSDSETNRTSGSVLGSSSGTSFPDSIFSAISHLANSWQERNCDTGLGSICGVHKCFSNFVDLSRQEIGKSRSFSM